MASSTLSAYIPLYVKTTQDSLRGMLQAVELLHSQDRSTREKAQFEAFRIAHSLRSSSLLMGYKQMGQLMTALEQYFDQVKNNKTTIDQTKIHALHKCIQQAQKDIESIESNSVEIDLTDQIAVLKHLNVHL